MPVSGFGEILRRHRIMAGWTQEVLAERAGLSARAISDLERGLKQTPRPTTVRLLAAALALGEADAAALFAAARGQAKVRPQGAPPGLAALMAGLVGRAAELAAVQGWLGEPHVRLVTITGVGGVGKTRLAMELARRPQAMGLDGALMVPLAEIEDPALVLPAVARALGVDEQPGTTLLQALARAFRTEPLLLVLDNLEHLLSAAPAVAELLAACPALKVLATSRAPLRVYGEQEAPLAPLPVPPLVWRDAQELARCESVRLFVERARGVVPDFALDAVTAPAVAAICARLEGLPLAIELAAARLKALPPAALLARLGQPLDLLVDGPRDRAPRQQTLRNTLDWSYRLLRPEHQALLRHLSVFAGGWSLQAAEAVYETPDTALEGLTALVDASLIQSLPAVAGEARFGTLQTIRDYALERLAAAGEADSAHRRHAEYFAGLAEQAAQELNAGSGHSAWVQRLRPEHTNLRGALQWCIHAGETDRGLHLAGAVWRYWFLDGSQTERQAWLQGMRSLLAVGEGQPALRGTVLNGAGVLAISRGQLAEGRAFVEEGLALARSLDDRAGIANGVHNLGSIAGLQGDLEAARTLLEEANERRRAAGDGARAMTCNVLGGVLADQGDLAAARRWHAEALDIYRELGDLTGMASAASRAGMMAALQGDLPAADGLCLQALTLAREARSRSEVAWSCLDLALVRLLQHQRQVVFRLCQESMGLRMDTWGDDERTAVVLQVLAGALVDGGQPHQALKLFGAAEAVRHLRTPTARVWDAAMHAGWLERAVTAVGESAADLAMEGGRRLSREAAIALALDGAEHGTAAVVEGGEP